VSETAAIHRAASALRTALTGARLVRFEAPQLVGPTPRAGRVIEHVAEQGRGLQIEFDDGLVLDTSMKRAGAWHLYRHGDRWRRPHKAMRALVVVDDWMAVCFDSPSVETYRAACRGRHPAMGRLGPDISEHDADLRGVVNLLLSYPDGDVPLADVLLDQRVVTGVGNVFRSEVLWANELSPFAPVRGLSQRAAIRLVNAAAHQLRATVNPGRQPTGEQTPLADMAVFGRNGQRCGRCGETIEMRPMGVRHQMLYWCPGCQTRLGPRRNQRLERRAMDPHPAAQKFLADLPWNRDVG